MSCDYNIARLGNQSREAFLVYEYSNIYCSGQAPRLTLRYYLKLQLLRMLTLR